MRNLTVSGSGAEDIGVTRTREHTLSDATYAESARLESIHRAAEDNARNRRLDRERIICAALNTLESESMYFKRSTSAHVLDYDYIAGCAGLPLGHGEPNRADYVAELLAEIRAELSPLVR